LRERAAHGVQQTLWGEGCIPGPLTQLFLLNHRDALSRKGRGLKYGYRAGFLGAVEVLGASWATAATAVAALATFPLAFALTRHLRADAGA
jgi:hypothetical protein